MKHIRLSSLFAILALALFSNKSWAQGGSVEGFYGVGNVSSSISGTSSSLSGRYWSEYLGGEFGLRYLSGRADIEGTDIVDTNGFGFGANFLAGIPVDNLKPHLALGFTYVAGRDKIDDFRFNEFDLNIGLGLDIPATDRILIGLDVVQFSVAISGALKSGDEKVDIAGNTFGAFSGFRVGYRF